ncbi:hypothetical protein BGZ54_002810, partial [Gamsiella multidivaricata]
MEAGLSTGETATRLKISTATRSRIYSSNKENMPMNKGGRPRKINAETVEFIKLNLKRGVLQTAVQAKTQANQLLPQPVSITTIRRRLREA